MQFLFLKKSHMLGGAMGILALCALTYYFFFYETPDTRERARVTRGEVAELVSVSGSVRTRNTAELGFAGTGVIENVLVREGDTVKRGQILATLAQAGPLADYNDALAFLAIKEAERAELVEGPRAEERTVTEAEVSIARSEVARVEREENEKVDNARRALYSDDLVARPLRAENDDTPPTLSGTYTCKEATTYRFATYPSGAPSGYSYRILAGNGTESEAAVIESAAPFSNCGLYIQFADNVTYGNQEWIIDVPNTKGARYTANLGAYTLALKNRENAVELAKQNLEKILKDARLDNAAPRTEALVRADANVRQAKARLASAEAKIADVTIRAPFDGIITDVALGKGEIGTGATAVIMTANDGFELKIRVPEIDIAHIAIGDPVTASFDANPADILSGTVTFVSPLPTEIDGVAYFEAYVGLTTVPTWMRTGLNADVDIAIEKSPDVLRVPSRFIREDGDTHFVLVDENGNDVRKPVEIGLAGNTGYIEIRGGIAENTEVIAP